MDEASQQAGSDASAHEPVSAFLAATGASTPTLSICFAVEPNRTVAWRITSDATLRVYGERVWLTRAHSLDDHWLGPGDTIRVARGERIWLSSDGERAARVTLTSAWSRRRVAALAWFERLAGWTAAAGLRGGRRVR